MKTSEIPLLEDLKVEVLRTGEDRHCCRAMAETKGGMQVVVSGPVRATSAEAQADKPVVTFAASTALVGGIMAASVD